MMRYSRYHDLLMAKGKSFKLEGRENFILNLNFFKDSKDIQYYWHEILLELCFTRQSLSLMEELRGAKRWLTQDFVQDNNVMFHCSESN